MRFVLLLAPLFLITCINLPAQVNPALFQALEWRNIGPFRAGRSVAATGVPGDANTFYFGAVGGGVWKSANAGITWSPLFDAQKVASIGAIEVAPSDHSILYVGTGETDIRSDIGMGDGVYKSLDAGKTWRNTGLRDSKHIGRILVHPKDSNTVFVAALGHTYGPNAERGVYRSKDGGTTWQKVLDRGPETGAVDLAWDPNAPDTIYASMWHARRTPWSQYPPNNGPGSGLWRSTDSGDHWTELKGNGLPDGDWGRSGIAVARNSPVVYLVAEAKAGGLFRSNDRGATWMRVSTDARLTSRAWYFSGVTVDPNDPETVYLPNVGLNRSTDGGKTFQVIKGAPGGDDYHYLWMDPTNSARMILATDQGTVVSLDRGTTWSTWYNQPTAQMYHVAVDNAFPYNVYGAQQDSGTVMLPSRTNHGYIADRDLGSVGGAESGYIAADPLDQNILYVGNTYGSLTRFDKRTAQGQNVSPAAMPTGLAGSIADRKYRFPWTSPVVFSPTERGVLYFGAQVVLETRDGGLNWREISPDLTGDTRAGQPNPKGLVPAVETAKAQGFGVIYTIAPSPLTKGQIWAGSDTGLIHLTRDGGKTWANVTPPGIPDWSKITHLEASHFEAGEAWAAIDRHRRDDYKPWIYRTRDFGKTWQKITGGMEEPAFLNCIREDPAKRGLLYSASETGVYVSFDDGDNWQSLQLNMPTVSVRDVVVHGDDLVIATHGRGFWILDAMSALRQIDPKGTKEEAILYGPGTAVRMSSEGFQGTPLPVEVPLAKNGPEGVPLDFYLSRAPAGDVTLEVLTLTGELIRRYSTSDIPPPLPKNAPLADAWLKPEPVLQAKAGMNRFVWDLRYAAPSMAGRGGEEMPLLGPQVLPGTYQVRFTAGGKQFTQPVTVALDPRVTATPDDLTKQFTLAKRALDLMSKARGTPSLRKLAVVLNVTGSADRTPPATAYALYEEAAKELGQ